MQRVRAQVPAGAQTSSSHLTNLLRRILAFGTGSVRSGNRAFRRPVARGRAAIHDAALLDDERDVLGDEEAEEIQRRFTEFYAKRFQALEPYSSASVTEGTPIS